MFISMLKPVFKSPSIAVAISNTAGGFMAIKDVIGVVIGARCISNSRNMNTSKAKVMFNFMRYLLFICIFLLINVVILVSCQLSYDIVSQFFNGM